VTTRRPWMPTYVADYMGDTRHLTRAQHGSYLLLIFEYWQRGGLPVDEHQIARLGLMTEREWRAERHIYAEFFGPGWKHKRIDAELAKAEAISEARKGAVSKRKYRPPVGNVVPIK